MEVKIVADVIMGEKLDIRIVLSTVTLSARGVRTLIGWTQPFAGRACMAYVLLTLTVTKREGWKLKGAQVLQTLFVELTKNASAQMALPPRELNARRTEAKSVFLVVASTI